MDRDWDLGPNCFTVYRPHSEFLISTNSTIFCCQSIWSGNKLLITFTRPVPKDIYHYENQNKLLKSVFKIQL